MNSYIYIMTNKDNTVIYIGVTRNLMKRVWEHKTSTNPDSFTSRYKCFKLVYCELFGDIKDAIAREKQLKNWKRDWKIELINKENPEWLELNLD